VTTLADVLAEEQHRRVIGALWELYGEAIDYTPWVNALEDGTLRVVSIETFQGQLRNTAKEAGHKQMRLAG
jgi:hypothetical protein